MAEIDENERQNEIENEKMMTMTEHTDGDNVDEVEVEADILTVTGGNVRQEYDIHVIEVDEKSIEVEEVMITGEKVVGEKGEAQNKEKVEEAKEEKEEKSILEETETGKKFNGILIPNTEPSLSLYEYSPKSAKSLTPIFSRLTQPVLKTEIVANKIETKNEPMSLFPAVPKGCKIENTEKDNEWTLDLLASSPMPTVSKFATYYRLNYSHVFLKLFFSFHLSIHSIIRFLLFLHSFHLFYFI